MSWSDVIGQRRVKEILRTSLRKSRLAHAYLFSGPDGAGQDAMAVELARTVNCEAVQDAEACDKCPSCGKVSTYAHPDVNFIVALPVGKNEKTGDPPLSKLSDDEVEIIREQLARKASNPYQVISIPRANTIKINSVREIRRESSMTRFGGGMRVFIIIDAELMNDEASNALLKTLEEPPPSTLLILTTSQPDLLLPTIVSRCQKIQFDRVDPDEIQDALIHKEGTSEKDAHLVARLAEGSYGRALQLLSEDSRNRQSEAVDFLRVALSKSKVELVQMIDRLSSSYERPDIEELLAMVRSWMREAMLVSNVRPTPEPLDDNDTFRRFVARFPNTDYGGILDAIDRAVSLLSKNVYIPLVLLNLSFDLQRGVGFDRDHHRRSIDAREADVS